MNKHLFVNNSVVAHEVIRQISQAHDDHWILQACNSFSDLAGLEREKREQLELGIIVRSCASGLMTGVNVSKNVSNSTYDNERRGPSKCLVQRQFFCA